MEIILRIIIVALALWVQAEYLFETIVAKVNEYNITENTRYKFCKISFA